MTELIDGKKERQEILKSIILDLHAGEDMEKLKERFSSLIRNVGPSEIGEMEEELIKEGLAEQEVKKLCDVHVAVFKESLDRQEKSETLPGHPVHTFRKENQAITKIITSLRELFEQLKASRQTDKYRRAIEEQLALLKEINKHYLRKENQLFPLFEKHGISGPPKVMWQIHDDVRSLLKEVDRLLSSSATEELLTKADKLLTTISEMIYKEENILFPMATERLSEADWGKVRFGEEEIGYALVTPGSDWQPPAAENERPGVQGGLSPELKLNTGYLTCEQVNLMLTHLPLDITFVDEHGKVRYYSQGQERIFPRSPGIIGREVQNCHPADSVHIVNKIVEEFQQGTKSTADFWLNMNGRLIYIRYFPVRDQTGQYRGVVEVTQDITEIRSLQGEKRLLDW